MRPVVAAAVAGAMLASMWGRVLYPTEPAPSDPDVAYLGARFETAVRGAPHLAVSSRGALRRDRDTFFWSLFTDKFGSNPNTPYMWNALPLMGFLLPSPMYNLGRHDAVVLLSRLPPQVEYFSFTTFALFLPRRGLPFSSLGDSVNNLNINHTASGLFAHVVTGNARTFALVEEALAASGIPREAVNLAVVPSDLGIMYPSILSMSVCFNTGLFDDVLHLGGQMRVGTYFETVLRLFRFKNQTAGDAYLQSHPPVFYLRASHGHDLALPTPRYKSRAHPGNRRETPLLPELARSSTEALSKIGAAVKLLLPPLSPVQFGPLKILGLECLKRREECLGDCPDAAYYGPHVLEDNNTVQLLRLERDDELHLIMLVNHRTLNVSVYGSVAVLKPAIRGAESLDKTHMKVRATELGVTSFDFPASKFVAWVFTRNAQHCTLLAHAVDGCSVVLDSHVSRQEHLTYVERIYLNPVSGTGPDWTDLVGARLYQIDLAAGNPQPAGRSPLFARLRLPAPMPVGVYEGKPLRFLHIVKTGGEALEHHLGSHRVPSLDFAPCRATAMSTGWTAEMSTTSPGCLAAAAVVSSVLCGLNCECCAADIRQPDGGFHGTLIRSPRAHSLSLFSHGHVAHHTTLARILRDVPLFLAETILRGTEAACGSFCTGKASDWKQALQERLFGIDPPAAREEGRPLRVLPMDNTQAHALTCSKSRGSLGQHFRVLGAGGGDALAPKLDAALSVLSQLEWVGVTDLYEPSLCLLHYMANRSLPARCDCNTPARHLLPRLGHWVEQRSQRRLPSALAADVLERLDAHTAVDAQVFAAALRLLLSRLRTVEEQTGAELLWCIDWVSLHADTHHIRGLWTQGPHALLESGSDGFA